MSDYVSWLVLNKPGSGRSNILKGAAGGVPVEIVGVFPAPAALLVELQPISGEITCPAGVPTPLLALTAVPGGQAFSTHRFWVRNTGANSVTVSAEPSSDGVHVDADPDNVLSWVVPAGQSLPLEVTGKPAAPCWGLEANSASGTTLVWGWFAAQ